MPIPTVEVKVWLGYQGPHEYDRPNPQDHPPVLLVSHPTHPSHRSIRWDGRALTGQSGRKNSFAVHRLTSQRQGVVLPSRADSLPRRRQDTDACVQGKSALARRHRRPCGGQGAQRAPLNETGVQSLAFLPKVARGIGIAFVGCPAVQASPRLVRKLECVVVLMANRASFGHCPPVRASSPAANRPAQTSEPSIALLWPFAVW